TTAVNWRNSPYAPRCFAELSGLCPPPSLGSGKSRLVCHTGLNWKKSPYSMTIGIPLKGRCRSSLHCRKRLSTAASVRPPTWLIS
ncbi:hypothetical protein N657DRAFT_544690, partial [Parathielavia appendiculata]